MSQTATATAIQSAVEEMQALMRADGADLVVKELNVPAARLHLVVDLANVAALRIVIKNGFSRDLADLLIADLQRHVTYLEALPMPLPPKEHGEGFHH